MGRLGASAYVTFKKESSWGTAITTDTYYRCTSESLLPKYDLVQDDSLMAELYPTNQWKVGESVEGTLEGMLYADHLGYLMAGILGGEAAVANPALAYLLVSYNGSETYIRLSLVGTDLIAEKSSNGSAWSADTAFCTTGTMDLTNASYDTLTEVQAAIAGYTGYDCILFGAGSTASSKLVAFAVTALITADVGQGACLITAADTTSSTTKKHTFTPAALGSELPSFTFAVNRGLGTNKTLTFAGCKFKTLTWTNTPKDVEKVSLAISGKVEAIDQTDVSVTVPTVEPYKIANAKLVFEDATGNLVEFTECKSLTLTFNPNLTDDRVLGSLYPIEQIRQSSALEISGQANNTSAQYALISQYKAFTPVAMYLYVKTDGYADTTNVVPYSVFMRIPKFIFKDFSSPVKSKDLLMIDFSGATHKTTSSVYTSNVYAYVTDTVTATY